MQVEYIKCDDRLPPNGRVQVMGPVFLNFAIYEARHFKFRVLIDTQEF